MAELTFPTPDLLFATAVIAPPDIMAGDLIFQCHWDSHFGLHCLVANNTGLQPVPKDLETVKIYGNKNGFFCSIHTVDAMKNTGFISKKISGVLPVELLAFTGLSLDRERIE